MVKVTVCEMHEEQDIFAAEWSDLVAHVKAAGSDVVLLPEMPFSGWFAINRSYDPKSWQAAVEAHDHWLPRLHELAPAAVLASRPVALAERRLNEGFLWADDVYRTAHHKAYLPDEEGTWEASWYHRGTGEFALTPYKNAQIGFLICSELWAMDRAREYGKAGTHLLVTPRATGKTTVDKWLAAGRVAAVLAGAFSLSSNRIGSAAEFGGQGWVVNPDGTVLALTSADQPFVTVEIDLTEADHAKTTYPRYCLD